MPKGFFITGTDTGVGKTLIAGALIRGLAMLGIKAGGMKPVETGCGREGDVLIPYDGMYLKQIAHMQEPITLVTPCCFEHPLAPLAASEIEKTAVSRTDIRKAFHRLSRHYDAIVVEGIGGLLVPIKKDSFVIDLAEEFGLPLIVVAKPGLGTINHIMLTVQYARKSGLDVAGVIINYAQPPENSLAEETNPELLSQVCPVPIIGVFPYLKSTEENAIEGAVVKNLNLEAIAKYIDSK
jgi:dethiobiotin synthetase